MSPKIAPVLLLLISNVFMTFAWYGHLKFENRPLYLVILVSWLIALVVFAVFSVLYLGEKLTLNHLVGFGFICLGAFFVFKGPLR